MRNPRVGDLAQRIISIMLMTISHVLPIMVSVILYTTMNFIFSVVLQMKKTRFREANSLSGPVSKGQTQWTFKVKTWISKVRFFPQYHRLQVKFP